MEEMKKEQLTAEESKAAEQDAREISDEELSEVAGGDDFGLDCLRSIKPQSGMIR